MIQKLKRLNKGFKAFLNNVSDIWGFKVVVTTNWRCMFFTLVVM